MLRQHQSIIKVSTRPKSMNDVSATVAALVAESGISTGICTVYIRHTSASLVIQENFDSTVRSDLERFLARLAPEDGSYEHRDEGPDDMPSHIRSAVTRTSECIPVVQGKLALGTWQGLYVWEHRSRPYQRELVVHIIGE